MNTFISYVRESTNELKHVTWPKQDELLRLTIITVVFVLITAFAIGLIDYGFSQGYQWLLTIGQ